MRKAHCFDVKNDARSRGAQMMTGVVNLPQRANAKAIAANRKYDGFFLSCSNAII